MSAEQDYFSQIQQYENFSHDHPGLYKIRVVLSALLAYLFIFLVIISAIGLIALILMATLAGKVILLKLIFPFIILLYGLLRSLWIKFSPPEGIALEKSNNQLLFSTLDHIRVNLDTPKIHQVLFTDDYNAAIVQIPRLGIFGWYKNYLLIGLPLMLALSPDQFKAVLAHELGHVSRAHGRIGSWIYRIRRTWLQISDYFESHQHWSNYIIRRFFEWFYPRFHAYSFILMREHEYEADHAAALVEGSRSIADALLNISLKEAYLSREFWPALYQQADDNPTPPLPYTEMSNKLQTGTSDEEYALWLQEAIAFDSDYDEVHPSLKDRLAALQEEARIPPAASQSAADYFLGERTMEVLKDFDLKWLNSNLSSWEEHFLAKQANKKRLNELREKLHNGDEFDAQNLMELGWYTEEFESAKQAQPLYQAALRKNPDFAPASYHLGRVLLEQEGREADALQYLHTAMEADHDFIMPGNQLLFQYYLKNNQPEEANRCVAKAIDFNNVLNLAEAERQVKFDSCYITHGLSSEQSQEIHQQLQQYPEINQAYLVRRKVKYLPERPMYVLGIILKRTGKSRKTQLLINRIASEVSFPGEAFIVELNWQNRKLNHIKKIKAALIYQSGS